MEEQQEEKGDIRNVPKQIIKEFIEIYKSHPALWQIKNKEVYGNRTLKYRGLQALVEVWKKYDSDANSKMVKNKIQSLRGSFRKELKKIQNSQRSGCGTEDIYKSQLWYYSLMTFLTEHEQPTESVDNFERELTQDSETLQNNDNGTNTNEERDVGESVGVNTTAVTASSDKFAPVKKKKKVEEEEKRKFLKACTDALGTKETENDAFGKFITQKFLKISDSEQRMYAESLITKVANYAILNKLTEFSDIMGNYSLLRDTNTPMSNYSSSTSTSHSATHQSAAPLTIQTSAAPLTIQTSAAPLTIETPEAPLTIDSPQTSSCAYYDNVACYETIQSEYD